MNRCLLDVLPAEIFHIIFNYFWAHEIFTIFSDVSPYLNAVLVSYSSYQVNFRSILKPHFDHICRVLRPDQILSLILSDSYGTPHQSELFLSHYRADSFTRLRSLTLDKIETKSLVIILRQIQKLNRHVRLSLHNCDINPLVSIEISSQLQSLKIGSSNSKKSRVPLSVFNTKSSTLPTDDFEHICENASQLQSLHVRCDDTIAIIRSLLKLPQLTRLVLEITGKHVWTM
ncbi:unnamed protein product [Rotaria socialis]|uniref:F-box domain-containing protein n=1 Tax=Rotaria socialis TaxID=392032 RepID=A0A818MF03_9BILA|nr:unnamed protein product [Rotaria socialis]CAF4866173.1 unnamed protein product [Rotaria socialis]